MADAGHGAAPPRLPFVLSVGVTGHRLDALPSEAIPAVRQRLADLLAGIRAAAQATYAAEGENFLAAPPRLILVSPLADGADQIAAEIALPLGFELQAILPFDRSTYRLAMAERSNGDFDRLIDQAICVLELPGEADRSLDAYVMAGRATVSHCDVLVAVWDGLPPRGRGGTGEVVELALTAGTPVIHVPIEADGPVTLRWSAYDPVVITRAASATTVRPFDAGTLEQLLTALLTPPPDPQERRFLRDFEREHRRRYHPRIEYPMLLAAAGVARFGAQAWRSDRCSLATRAEWGLFRRECEAPHGVTAPLDTLEQWYDWADSHATHFAQSYRSGHVFNFLLGAFAVLLALTTLIRPEAKTLLAILEFVVILAILLNTRVGMAQQWHRRWLDYRQLAERLRPMRSLKLLGVAAPDPPGSATLPVPSRWIDWYAAAAWRALGCPSGSISSAQVPSLARAIACHELEPQIAYHRRSAAQIHRLDHRLERLATGLFGASILSCVVLLVALWIDPDWVKHNSNWFTVVSAGLPAIGTAIFGIRFQGDFGGSAIRSETTAKALEEISAGLMDEHDLARCADLVEQAARAMLADLDEWRLLNQQHDLSIS